MTRSPSFKNGDPVVAPLFQSGEAKRAAARVFVEAPIEILPGYYSNDPRMIKFKDTLSRDATREFPMMVDEFGRLYGNGVRSNFYGIRHINGLPMIPATWPITNNELKRKNKKLADRPLKKEHENLWRACVRLFFSGLEPVPLRLRRGSSTCCPDFTTSDTKKEMMARAALSDARAAGELMLKGDYESAFLLYKIGGCYYVVYRAQSTDKISLVEGKWVFKDREVADELYALTGGHEGMLLVADKLAPFQGKPLPQGFARERRRTAMGVAGPIGAALMPIAQSVRARIYKEYGFSFHHTTRVQKEEKAHKWDMAIATDVSDHDMNFPTWLFDLIEEELLAMGYAEWWVKLWRTSLSLPVYVSSPAPDQGSTLLGDWRKPNLRCGLPSGNPFTDLLGTILMSVTYCITQLEWTAKPWLAQCGTVEKACLFFSAYLKGALPFGQMSKSDDALLLWKEGPAYSAAVALREKLKDDESVSDYMHLSYEHGGAFLGTVVLYDSTFLLRNTNFTGNILSMLNNDFSPEYGVDSGVKDRSRTKRPYPGIAWGSRAFVYGTAPVYAAMMDLIQFNWKRATGESYIMYREALLKQDQELLARETSKMVSIMRGDVTPIEAEVLDEPTKLQWKFSESDVRPEIRSLIFHGLPLEEVVPYFNTIVPGHN